MGVRLQGLESESFERTAQALTTRIGADRVQVIENEATDVPLESVLDDTLALLSRPAHSHGADGRS